MSESIYSIYLITNIVNNKQYVGFTSQDPPERRWCAHNHGGHYLHKNVKTFGKECFKFEVIYQSKHFLHTLNVMEPYFIKNFNARFPTGYNLTDGGDGIKGFVLSEESRLKMSNSKKGQKPRKKISEETRQRLRNSKKGKNNPNYGKITPPETRKKMSESNKGANAYWYGKKMSEASRKKMSDAKIGTFHSEYTKQKRRDSLTGEKNPMFGKSKSEEVRKKISDSLKLYYQNQQL